MRTGDAAVEYALVLGSNRDPARHFRLALRHLPALGDVARCAGPLRTRDARSGRRFLNAAVLLESVLDDDALRAALRAVEDAAGRVRGADEVVLDIDLVASRRHDGNRVVHKPEDLQRGYVRTLLDELGFPDLSR